ncbi:hypothetical protein IWW36_002007 [Coemansia brasiliensis]|uniref:SET domain-containing protein n=1 Tax=Coemansia brasiliensis TaxID=2650707 RepID=A0A9W8I815_9FUNG|nr:hypothetical protein IWW36_002007 [Coemansia brasiliensis]
MNLIERLVKSNGLYVVDDAIKGKRTVAEREFKRGEVLLSIPPLYSFPLYKEPTDSQHPTAATKLARLTDQQQIDKAAMKLKPEYREYLYMTIGIGAMLHYVASTIPSKVPEWLHVQANAWYQLVSHRQDHSQLMHKQYGEIARVIAIYGNVGPLRFSNDDGEDLEDAIVTALCRSGCNNFATYEPHCPQMSGYMCSPLISLLFNHSCLPNATFVFSKGMQVVRALEDINQGDEITLTYADALLPRKERQTRLAEVYFFNCLCKKCTPLSVRGQIDGLMSRALEVSSHMPRLLPTDYAKPPAIDPWVMQLVQLFNNFILEKSTDEFEQEMLKAISITDACDMSFAAYQHWLECQDECLDRLSRGSTDANVMLWSCISSLYVLAFYILAYPPYYSLIGFQCLQTAKLLWNTLITITSIPEHFQAIVCERQVGKLARCALNILKISADPTVSTASNPSINSQIELLYCQQKTS